MARPPKLRVEISADTRKFKKGVREVTGESQKMAAKVTGSAKSVDKLARSSDRATKELRELASAQKQVKAGQFDARKFGGYLAVGESLRSIRGGTLSTANVNQLAYSFGSLTGKMTAWGAILVGTSFALKKLADTSGLTEKALSLINTQATGKPGGGLDTMSLRERQLRVDSAGVSPKQVKSSVGVVQGTRSFASRNKGLARALSHIFPILTPFLARGATMSDEERKVQEQLAFRGAAKSQEQFDKPTLSDRSRNRIRDFFERKREREEAARNERISAPFDFHRRRVRLEVEALKRSQRQQAASAEIMRLRSGRETPGFGGPLETIRKGTAEAFRAEARLRRGTENKSVIKAERQREKMIEKLTVIAGKGASEVQFVQGNI